MPLHIAIDVDQTILDDEGRLIAGVRETLARMHANDDYELQLWSKGGADYAREVANKFDLVKYFKSFGTKPDVAIDDLPEDAAPVCRLGVPFIEAAKAIDDFVAAAVETTLHPSRKVIELVADIQAEQGEIEQAYRGNILRDGMSLELPASASAPIIPPTRRAFGGGNDEMLTKKELAAKLKVCAILINMTNGGSNSFGKSQTQWRSRADQDDDGN